MLSVLAVELPALVHPCTTSASRFPLRSLALPVSAHPCFPGEFTLRLTTRF